MTAAALAGELELRLFSIQLHGFFTKYMGQTAARLPLVFDADAGAYEVVHIRGLRAAGHLGGGGSKSPSA